MLGNYLIGLREGLEAALVVSILVVIPVMILFFLKIRRREKTPPPPAPKRRSARVSRICSICRSSDADKPEQMSWVGNAVGRLSVVSYG